MVNKRVWNAVLGCNLKSNKMISVHFQGKPFNMTVIQVYSSTSNAEEAEVEQFYETKNSWPFHYRGMECKSRKSRDTGSNRKIWPWSTKWIRAKANKVLPRERTGHSKHVFQPHKRRLYTWTSPDGQYQNQTDYILYSQRWRNSIQSARIRPGADCDLDHEHLIAKFRLKLKKVGITTRLFRYDLNQIPYDYSMAVTNRLKGLDLIDRVPEELWTEIFDIYRRQLSRPFPRKRNAKM